MKSLVVILFFIGCSSTTSDQRIEKNFESETTFRLTDSNGSYLVKKEIKFQKRRLVSRLRYFGKDGVTQLENTVAVSRVGSLKKGKGLAILPEASQFKVWFEKEEYSSQAKILPGEKKIAVSLKSPQPLWQGVKEFQLPKTRYICFFSQLPECLKLQKLLIRSARQPITLYIIWDNFPYQTELYSDLEGSIVTAATLSATKQVKDEFKFDLDIGSQILFFHYDRNLNFTKMFWVAQGISMVKLGAK